MPRADTDRTRNASTVRDRTRLPRLEKTTVFLYSIETLNPSDGERALAEMQQLGARLTTTNEVLENVERVAERQAGRP